MKTKLFNNQISPTGLNLYACIYTKKKDEKPGVQQTELFAINDQREFNRKALQTAQELFKPGDRFYPSDLRSRAPSLAPARPKTMWGPAYRGLLHNGFKLTHQFRKSHCPSLNGCREFEYERVQ